MENEQALMKKARALQKDLSNELLKLEKTQQQQAENDALLKELNNQVVEVKKEIDNSNDRITKLRAEAQQLDEEKSELQKAISNREADEKARLIPEIERCRQRIGDMHAEIAKNEEAIENENGKSATLQEKITELEKVKDEKKEAYEQLQSEYLKQKDEPNRLGKQNENLKIQVRHQQSELDGFKAKVDKYQRDHDNEMKQNEKLQQ
jgi:chromosome segregation ATPase